jgi:hypothetical protein
MSIIGSISDKREAKPKTNRIVDELLTIAGSPDKIFIPKLFVQFTGSLVAAAVLNQLLYWHERGDLPDNWTYKSDVMWSEELCISKYAAEQARKILTSMGLVKTRVRRAPNGTPMHHYQCNIPHLRKLWTQFLKDPVAWAEEARDKARITRAA